MMPFSAMRLRAAAGEDPYFANVISLVHFDGADGSTTITDQIAGNTWTVNTSTISSTNPKFGVGCLAVNSGTSAGITKNNLAAQRFNTGDFTMELWVRPDTLSSGRGLVDSRSSSSANIAPVIIHNASGVLEVYVGTTLVITGSALAAGVYQHVALSRASGVSRLFLDGVQVGSSYPDTNDYVHAAYRLGRTISNSTSFLGRIDEWRATKGVGRYVADFTPPTSAFPDS